MPDGVSYEGIFGDERREAIALGRNMRGANRSVALGQMYFARPQSRSAGGAMGGGVAAGAAAASPPAAPRPKVPLATAPPPALNAAKSSILTEAQDSAAVPGGDANEDIRNGSEAGQKRLAALKPDERRALLRQVKLAPALREALAKPDAATTANERVEVQVWLNTLPPDGLNKLKALGFDLAATLTPNKLLLGTVSRGKLDALIELGWVRRVEPPRFK
jgi:hypothetical protein